MPFPGAGETYNIQVLVHYYNTCRRALFCVLLFKLSNMQTVQVSSLGKLTHQKKALFQMSCCEWQPGRKPSSSDPHEEVDGIICTGKLREWFWNRNENCSLAYCVLEATGELICHISYYNFILKI